MSSVLIVEDEPVLRRSLSTFLEGRGHQVAQAATLAEARQRLGNGSFDSVFLDVYLPDGNGLDLVAEIGRRRAIVVTGRPDPAAFRERGVVHRMDKPLDLQRAADLLESVVSRGAATPRRSDRP